MLKKLFLLILLTFICAMPALAQEAAEVKFNASSLPQTANSVEKQMLQVMRNGVMKNNLRFLSGSLLFLVILLSNAAAQDEGIRINFKRGTSSATVKGTVAKGGPDFYLVGAKAGQTMTVKVMGKVSFGIDSLGERLTEDDGNTSWSEKLPADGDYKIKVFSSGGAQDDKIEFKLPNENGARRFTGTISSAKPAALTLNESGTRSVLKEKCYK